MQARTPRIAGLIAGALALFTGAIAHANPFTQQLNAVVEIGSEQIELRYESGLEIVQDARAEALAILFTADELNVDDDTLRLAEYDAKAALRRAAKLAHDDIRGMAANTLITLENFGATQTQIVAIVDLWGERSDELDEAIELALDDIDQATPAYSAVVTEGLVPIDPFSADPMADAQRILENMAIEMEAEIRAATDDEVRTLRYEKTRSHTPRTMKKMMRETKRDTKRQCKDMLATLKEQFKAHKALLKDRKASRSDKRALKILYKDARQHVKDAMDDAKADLKAAR